MKIIAGVLGGRRFNSPRGNLTHPMSEKVRGALFNSIGGITGLTLLDAFAGSGALSFEALSRGARYAVAIEADVSAHRTIVESAADLGITKQQLKAVRANCFTWSTRNENQLFDIVIADPPYETKRLNHRHVFKMLDNVKPGGLFVVSVPPHDQMVDYYAAKFDRLREVMRKDYGDTQLIFYRLAS
jgi:16S rRNA (guanine966-N2)-methyltransferase